MNQTQNDRLTSNAQALRRAMTLEERHLWYDFLKKLPVTINRQKVLGRYIVDFYCAAAKIVVELDGGQHYEPEAMAADRIRDAFLRDLGITVLRYTNADIHHRFKEVCDDIYRHIPQLTTSSPPAGGASPQGEAKD